jgi:hypothetical protein
MPNHYGGYQNTIYQNYDLDTRRPSTGDSQSTGTSGSLPSSAASSSIHLPLPNTHPAYSDHHERTSSSAYSDAQQGQPRHANGGGYPADGEGGFSSAFGLMSLDDPAVLAGLSDGVPFFDHQVAQGSAWNDGVTPRVGGNPGALGERPQEQRELAPTRGVEKAGQQTPSTLRELKDMWKAYMRTPLTGPQLSHSVSDAEGNSNGLSPSRSPKRDRERGERTIPRVASMPSVKTPDINAPASWDHIRLGAGNANQQQQQPARGGVNNPEDLRSYEQAVLARRAPLTLNLVPKRRIGSLSQAQPPPGVSISRPSSSSSSSSLAQAFGGEPASNSPSPAPLLHPASYAQYSAADARPGFKRLPSQTLGPEYAKRTAVAAPHADANAMVLEEDGPGAFDNGYDAPHARVHHGRPAAVSLGERARRMSVPAAVRAS